MVYVVNTLDEIYRRNGDGSYTELPGWAEDIRASDTGVWITGQGAAGGIYRKTASDTWGLIPSVTQTLLGTTIKNMGAPRLAITRAGRVLLSGFSYYAQPSLFLHQGVPQGSIDLSWNDGVWDFGHFTRLQAYPDTDGEITGLDAGPHETLWMAKGGKVNWYRWGLGTSLAPIALDKVRNVSVAGNGVVWMIRQGGSIYRATPN